MQGDVRKGSMLDLAVAVWRRRKWLAIVVFVAALSGVLGLVSSLPNVYESAATVLVERGQVAETLVRPSVTTEIETRLHTISQETLSRGRLGDLIARFDLYPELKRRAPLEVAIERMRRDIKLEPKEVEARWGRGATIAFTLSYRGRDPEKVALVTNTLAWFYVEENVRIRERQVAGTAEFLKAQLEEVNKRLEEQKRRVAEFKLRYAGELPHQMPVNLATLERLNAQLRLNDDRQFRILERREAQLKQLDGIGSGDTAAESSSVADRLVRLNRELVELRTRFTDRYPDVIRVKAEIAALEQELVETKLDDRPEGEPAARSYPARPRLKEALRELDAELRRLKAEERTLREAIAAHERRVENAPKREQEFQELSRDYEMTKELHSSLLKRYEEAQLAENMEQRQRGEQFRILDPAIPSKQPVAPNRVRLLLFGMMLSLTMAAGAVMLAEQMDSSFHTLEDLRAFTEIPVLGSIPRIVTEGDTRRRRWRFWLATVAVGFGLALIVGGSSYIARENEQLVWMLTRGRS